MPDVLAERLGVAHVGRDQHRAPVLVAAVDHRVQLLEPPLVLLRHGEVLENEEVDAPEQLQQPEVGVLRAVLVRGADAREQLRPREDRERAALAQHLLGDAHREAGLAAADLAEEVEPAAVLQVVVEAAAVLPHLAHDPLVEVRDRPALEVDVEVAPAGSRWRAEPPAPPPRARGGSRTRGLRSSPRPRSSRCRRTARSGTARCACRPGEGVAHRAGRRPRGRHGRRRARSASLHPIKHAARLARRPARHSSPSLRL